MAKGQYQQWTTEEGQRLLKGWKRAGMSNADIAKKIGVATGTLNNWATQYHEIRDALKKGKQLCDFEAEEALIGLFEGHYVIDTTTETYKDGTKHVKEVKRWIEPNTTALLFYLKCRAGWRENPETDETDKDNDAVLKFVEGLKHGSKTQ